MEAAHLVVARFLKPHGLKGEAVVLPLTDEPEEVFVPGRVLCPVDADGNPVGDPLVIARARPFHRRWLLLFEGLESRAELEQWPQRYLGARASELRPPNDDELYVHEIPGAVVMEHGVAVAVAKGLVTTPGGDLLVVEREGREQMIPFRPPFLIGVDRQERRINVELPPGLLEL